MSFNKKAVLVTGASSGIGASVAIEFSKEGADVVIIGRNEKKMAKVAAECESHGKKPLVIKADVSNEEEATAAVEKTIEKLGKLDVLVNNAGILRCATLLDGGALKAYDELMATNLRAAIHFTMLATPHLVKTKGSVVNISSVSGFTASLKAYFFYGITKAALNHFTCGAALELAPHGVRVNAVSPGPVITDIVKNAGPSSYLETLEIETALNRRSQPVEVADLVLFLSSEKAKGITGSNYVADNGFMLTN